MKKLPLTLCCCKRENCPAGHLSGTSERSVSAGHARLTPRHAAAHVRYAQAEKDNDTAN